MAEDWSQSGRRRMTKNEWLSEGKELVERSSRSCWEIGEWFVRGEQLFLEQKPATKRALRRYYAARRVRWMELLQEASKNTNLKASTLRQYARVARNGVKVEGLSFAHHLEVQRVCFPDEKGRRLFDGSTAKDLLNLAQSNKWTVTDLRAEVQRRYPSLRPTHSALGKVIRAAQAAIKNEERPEQIKIIELLIAELLLIKSDLTSAPLSTDEWKLLMPEMPF